MYLFNLFCVYSVNRSHFYRWAISVPKFFFVNLVDIKLVLNITQDWRLVNFFEGTHAAIATTVASGALWAGFTT